MFKFFKKLTTPLFFLALAGGFAAAADKYDTNSIRGNELKLVFQEARQWQIASDAYTIDTKAQILDSSANPVTGTYTCGAGTTLLVFSLSSTTSTTRTGGAPTYNGITLTQVAAALGDTGGEGTAELWYLLSPPTGSAYSVSVPNTLTNPVTVIISSYKAQAGYASVFDNTNQSSGTTANPSVSVTSSANGDVYVDSLFTGNTAPPTVGSGTILYGNDTGSESNAAQYYLQTNAGAFAMSYTLAADDWQLVVAAFKEVPVISGTSDMSSGTVKLAINGTLNANTGTISAGAWSILVPSTDLSSGNIVTVWRDATADDTTESTAITKYDGTGGITGMVLNANVLSIGSADNPSLAVSDFGYDCLDDEDVMHNATTVSTTLEVEGVGGACDNSYADEKINILSGATLTIGGSETLTTHNLTITGTLTSSGNSTYNVSGDWIRTGTFNVSTSTATFNGAGGSTQCVNGDTTFNNFTASATTARTIRFAFGSAHTVSNTWNIAGASENLTLDEAPVPSQVTGLSAAFNNATTITLNWSAPADNDCVTSYKVYRSTGTYALLESGGCSSLGKVLACTDTGLTEDTTYYYKVSAVNTAGDGTQSSEISATPQCIVVIGTQTWMCKNLNVGTKLASGSTMPSDPFDYDNIEKWCYDNSDTNCTNEGGLYTWAEAMGFASSCLTTTTGCSGSTPHQGICPSGFHIPTDTEMTTLTDYLSANSGYWCNATSTYIAKSLASTSGWTTSSTTCAVGNTLSTNNTSGFAALPSGNRHTNGSFNDRASYGLLWSASQLSATSSWYRDLNYNYATVSRDYYDKAYGFSVRCLKD